MATTLHQLLFVATIATVLSLFVSPAAAGEEGASMLVRNLCNMRGGEYSKQCFNALNNERGNSASNYQELLNQILQGVGKYCGEIYNKFQDILNTPFGRANSEVMTTCMNKFDKATQEFAAMATLDPGHKFAAFYDLERNFLQASDCEAALKRETITVTTSLSAQIMVMKLFTAVANDAIILIKKQEQTGGSDNGGEF